MTGPVEVIIPLPAPRPGLGGDFLGCASPGLTDTFLGGRSSSPSTFLLAKPLEIAARTNEDVPSYPLAFFASSFLRAATALTLCLAASFLQKTMNERQEKQTVKIKLMGLVKNLLTTMGVFTQSSSFRRWFRSPTI